LRSVKLIIVITSNVTTIQHLKGILSNLDHGDFVYIYMYEINRMEGINGHAVMFDTYMMYLI